MSDLHEICVMAVNRMVADGILRHVSYVSPPEDKLEFVSPDDGLIAKVTVEWVDEAEANPENFVETKKEIV